MHVDREGGTEWFCSRSMHLKYKGNEIVPVIRVERFAAKVYIVNLDNPLEVLFGGRGAGGLSLKTTNVRKKKHYYIVTTVVESHLYPTQTQSILVYSRISRAST